MIKKSLFLLISMLLLCVISNDLTAQTFDEWKKKRRQELQNFKEEREKQIQQLAEEFDAYVEKHDREFTDYLKERWRQFQVFQGVEPPEEPKPDVAPVYVEPERPEPPETLPVIKPALKEPPVIVPQPVTPRITKKEPEKFPANSLEFDFYGFPVVIEYDRKMDQQLGQNVNEEAISTYFNDLSQTNYNQLLEQLFEYSNQMSLNDWGFYLLLKNTSEQIAKTHRNTSRLLTWFLMIRSGYKAKAAFYENEVFVLLPIRNQVYGKNYFTFNNLEYYMMEGDLLNVYTYEKDLPEARKILDLNIYQAIALGDEILGKQYDFEFNGNAHPVDISYNSNIISFYKEYPLADIKVYFDAVVSPEAKISLTNNFVPLIQGKSELEAVNLLLHFVQTAFDYATDQDQFGYEKFFFAEEAFYYPSCDCEDRSVLFAYLVKSLLGLEVVGLNYPGHMSVAVRFNEDVSGDYITYEGRRYVVADPTYINAPVGLTMPRYAKEQAEVILLENEYHFGKQKDRIWEEVIAAGGQRGDNRQDLVFTPDGGSLVTGYFTDVFKLGDVMVESQGNQAMFLARLDGSGNPAWFSSSSGNGNAIAFGLVSDVEGNAFVTGTFEGEIDIEGNELQSEGTDIFTAAYNPDGRLMWVSQGSLDTANQSNFLNFVARFSKDGKHLGNQLYFETGDFDNYGISISDEGELVVAGAFNKTTGMNVTELSFDELEDFNIAVALKNENDRLIDQNYEKTIAGLFATVHLIRTSGMMIPGEEVQKVLDKHNPEFKTEFPDIFKTIKKIHFIKNQNGVVTVRTDDRKGVAIDMMRVSNEARIKVGLLDSGDARIDVLSGIRVGKAFWWFDLNYIVMYKHNGDMLFDFDTDHTQEVRNLKSDILY